MKHIFLILTFTATLFTSRTTETLSLANREDCRRGFYKTAKMCLPCPQGYYCPEGSSGTIVCTIGHYCKVLAFTPESCPTGTFNGNVGAAQCIRCTAGRYCDSLAQASPTGDCAAGYYCLSGSQIPTPNGVAGNICPPGYYCPMRTGSPFPCPAGTFGNNSGLTAVSECTPCLPGMYCTHGSKLPSGHCEAGYYCVSGNMTSTPTVGRYICPPGHYCPVGTNSPFPCPAGTFSSNSALTAVSDCTPCPSGKYCNSGSILPSGNCDAGYYCLGGSNTSRPTDGVAGDICSPGHYCPAGINLQIPCPGGTFGNDSGLSECIPCSPGYYCNSGSTTGTPTDGAMGNICPPGSYCTTGTDTPLPCPAGTFGNNSGLAAMSECIPCLSGYYCTNGSTTGTPTDGVAGNICPQGSYCPVGSDFPIPCPAGTFGNNSGLSECISCLSGYYCNSGSTTGTPTDGVTGNICPPGHFCLKGTAAPSPCPIGSNSTTVGLKSYEQCFLNISISMETIIS